MFFAGYGRAGKDTATDYVVKKYGTDKLAFADGVRDRAAEENRFFKELDGTYLQIIERLGYEEAKTHQCIRDYLVEIGEGSRQKYGELVWIDMLNEKAERRSDGGLSLSLSVPDCRYSNEEKYGRRRGNFILIRIKRKGCKAKHETERNSIKLLTPDHVVRNDGTVEEFLEKIDEIIFAFKSALF